MSRRIILLMQFYDPEPAYKGQRFAEDVARMGYDVEVVTGFPNYPGGTVYDGYRIRPIRREERNGIAITRLALYPSHDESRIGRVLNYVSFFLSAFLYLAAAARRADLVYVYHPPLTVGLAAAFAKLFRGTPFVLDIHDLWPDTLPATGMITNQRALRAIGFFCNWLYRRATHIIVQSEGFRQRLLDRGVPRDKLTVVVGWTDEDAIERPSGARPPGFAPDDGLRILFAGNIGKAQALSTVIDAARLLKDAEVNITFYFLGSGVAADELRSRAERDGLSNVRFLPRVPPAEVGAYLAAADCLLVHLRNDPLFAITIPSKTQAYLLAGRPLLMAVPGEAADLVEKAGAGLIVPPEDPEALARAALDLARMSSAGRAALGAAGRNFYLQHLTRAKGMAAFALVFKAVGRRRSVGRLSDEHG